jgi:hypothetical protein
MKWIVIVVMLLAVVTSGCVSVKWNPKTGDVVYTRFGPQKLSGIHIEDANGFYVAIESQESDAKIFVDMMGIAREWFSLGRSVK